MSPSYQRRDQELIPMNVEPTKMNSTPTHLNIVIFSWRNLIERRQTQIYPTDNKGYRTESSPYFNAMINNKLFTTKRENPISTL